MKKPPVMILAGLLVLSVFAYILGFQGDNKSQLARAFSEGQISAILQLLSAFNVDPETVAEIEQTLLSSGDGETLDTQETDEGTAPEETTSETTPQETTQTGTSTEEVLVTGPPTCTLTANRVQPLQYDIISFSWTTTNASSVSFDPDTTSTRGVYDLPLPEETLGTTGTAEVTANSVGGHLARLIVEGEQGPDDCTLSLTVLRGNATGYYEGKMNGNVFVSTIGVMREVAIDHCNKTVADNPEEDIVCTWRGDQIYPAL